MRRELVVTITIFLSPFLLYTHLFFSDAYLATFVFLGFEYQFHAQSNSYAAYYVLQFGIPLTIYMLLLLMTKRPVKVFLVFPIYMVLHRFFRSLSPHQYHDQYIIFKALALLLILTAIMLVFLRDHKKRSEFHTLFGILNKRVHKSQKGMLKWILVGLLMISLP